MNEIPGSNFEFDNSQIVQYEGGGTSSVPQQDGGFDIVGLLTRRWVLILSVFLPIAVGGVAGAFFLLDKQYKTTAAVEIAPIIQAILYSDSDSERPLPNYEAFKNTQAVMMASDVVLNRVADELYNKQLKFFEGVTDYRMRLREAVARGAITIEPQRNNNLIVLEMTGPAQYAAQAEMILNSIIQNYKVVSVGYEKEGEDTKLTNLEQERKNLQTKMESQQETIRRLVSEFGSSELTPRQQMMLDQVASLQKELITASIRKMALESQLQMQKNNEPNALLSMELLSRKNTIIQSDPAVQALLVDIRRYEDLVATGQQNMLETHPELVRRQEMLQKLQQRYDAKLKEVSDQVEQDLQIQQQRSQQQRVAEVQAELLQVNEYEKKLTEKINQQDTATINIGRRQFNIDDEKEQLAQTKARFSDVTQRIQQLVIESKRPARISIFSMSSSIPAEGKRKKIAGGAVFGAFALSFGLAFLLEKLDRRVHAPDEMVRRIGVRIIGTTTNPSEISQKLLGQQLVDDFQTIRANLSLLVGDEHKIIAVSSAGKGDGKTTFSINLATSFARSGKKTLLIDGDLRKPDVSYRLNLAECSRGLQDYLFGADLNKVLVSLNGDGLSILASDERNASDAGDLLGQKTTVERIRDLANHFDVVVIDTPPVLAFADALLWGKMADGVVMVCFLDKTSHPEIKQAMDRISQAGIKILGTVVNNVRVHQNYRRYGYGYGYSQGYQRKPEERKAEKKQSENLLLSYDSDKDNEHLPSKT